MGKRDTHIKIIKIVLLTAKSLPRTLNPTTGQEQKDDSKQWQTLNDQWFFDTHKILVK